MRQTHSLTAPLPFPIRTSVGLEVTGKSGNALIQILPFRFKYRFIIACATSYDAHAADTTGLLQLVPAPVG